MVIPSGLTGSGSDSVSAWANEERAKVEGLQRINAWLSSWIERASVMKELCRFSGSGQAY